MTTVSEPLAGHVRRGLAWSTASNVVLRISSLAVGVVMARLLAPEQFGVFAVALTVWVLLGQLAEFGLGADLVRRDDFERHVRTVGTLGPLLGGVLALMMCVSAPQIAQAFDAPAATGVIRLMSVSLLFVGFSIVPAALLQRSFRQSRIFAINGSALVVSTVTMTGLALAGAGPSALAWGRISEQLVMTVLQYAAVHRRPQFGWDPAVAREAMSFGLPLALANLLSWAIITMDNLVVARGTSTVEFGLYVLAFNVTTWPMTLIGAPIRVVALPAFARLASGAARAKALLTLSGPLWAATALMSAGLIFLAHPLVSVLYGARWSGAVAAVVPLAVFGALRVVFDMLATFLIALGMTRRVLLVQVVWLVALIPTMVYGVHVGGLAGAGWAHVVIGALVVLPAYLICLDTAGVDWLAFVGAWVRPTILGVPLALALVWVAAHLSPAILALGVGALAGLVLYALPMSRWWLSKVRSLNSPSLDSQEA